MSAPTLYRSLHLRRFDPELLAKVVSNVRLEHFLLGDGTCDFVHEHWEQQGVSLDVARYDFHTWVRGEMGNETLGFGFLTDVHGGCWINGAAVDASNLVVFSEGSELACRAGAGTHWAIIQMRRADLQECAVKILGRELCLPKQGMQSHAPRTTHLRVLREVIQSVAESYGSRSGIPQSELWRNFAVFALVDALAGVDDRRAEAQATKAEVGMQMVRLAEKHVLGNLAESYSSEEFAKALHMTERNLELQFNKIFGMPPHRWRECMGLNMAHRRLKRTRWRPGLVSEVAADCGFQHASRFAAHYMRIFGERPNDTGRREEGVTSSVQCSRRCARRLPIPQKPTGDTELVSH